MRPRIDQERTCADVMAGFAELKIVDTGFTVLFTIRSVTAKFSKLLRIKWEATRGLCEKKAILGK